MNRFASQKLVGNFRKRGSFAQNFSKKSNSDDWKYRALAQQQKEHAQKFFEMHVNREMEYAQRFHNLQTRMTALESETRAATENQKKTEKELEALSYGFAITCVTCATIFVANLIKIIQ